MPGAFCGSARATATVAAVALALAGCQWIQNTVGAGTVSGARTGTTSPATATAANADADMAQVLNALAALGARPVENLSVAQARSQPTPADAVRRVQQERGQSAAPQPVARVQDISIPSPAGPIPARIYNPGRGNEPLPLIVYWHGGGWVIADLDTYDASARALAEGTGAIVLSAHYRQGPEHKFPAAHDDVVATYRWATQNARRLGADPRRIAVAGESAGGNLAINAAIAAGDARLPRPVHMALIYPVGGHRHQHAVLPGEHGGGAALARRHPLVRGELHALAGRPPGSAAGRVRARGPAQLAAGDGRQRGDRSAAFGRGVACAEAAGSRRRGGTAHVRRRDARVLRDGAGGGRRHGGAGLRRAKAAERLQRGTGFDRFPLTPKPLKVRR